MNILEEREEYTFFQATSNAMTPDVMLSDIYEVDLNRFSLLTIYYYDNYLIMIKKYLHKS